MGHLEQLRSALDRERKAVEAEHAERRAMALPARRGLGFSLFPLSLDTTELRSRGRVNVVLRGDDLGDTFEPGAPVLLAPLGKPDVGVEARVEGADETALELRVADIPEGPGPWCVSRRLDFGPIEDMQAALSRAERLSGPLVALLLGNEQPWAPDPLEHPAFAALNPSQRAAAERVFGATEIGLLHGPPGTGKTHTLVALLKALRDVGERPWVLAESNAAVDHLALRAKAAGLNVVRLGVSARIGSEVQPLTLEWRILNGARAEVIRGLMRQASRTNGPEGWDLRDAIRAEWAVAKREILDSCDVLAMTLGTLASRGRSLAAPRTAVTTKHRRSWSPPSGRLWAGSSGSCSPAIRSSWGRW
jgi:ATP-dependent RNA/DNA helicase IGHMBP2